MRFILATLFLISSSLVAQTPKVAIADIEKVLNGINLAITKSFKTTGLNTHICKEVIKKNKNGKRKKKIVKKKKYKKGRLTKKVKKVVYFDKNGNKTFKGPMELLEIENSNPYILTI